MEQALTIAALRQERQETQEAFGAAIGVASKSAVSTIERGGPCSPQVALAIERLSGGRIDASALNDVVAASRRQSREIFGVGGIDHADAATLDRSAAETGNAAETSADAVGEAA